MWVLPCPDLDKAVADLVDAGFRTHSLGPADDPSYAVMIPNDPTASPAIRLETKGYGNGRRQSHLVVSPENPLSGVRWAVEDGSLAVDDHAAAASSEVDRPDSETLVFGALDSDEWVVGRAGMRYRDLLPGRWGDQFIASHIHIPDGGPVPDYVHFHDVEFQLIFCHRGWVRVVYEDQGEPFVLNPGDAILQAPGIRHQVLESSDDLYVVEISSPAEHPTYVEPTLRLPNRNPVRQRYGGQDYVHFVFDEATWSGDGPVRQRSLLLEAATDGRYGARVIEIDERSASVPNIDSSDFTLLVVLEVGVTVTTVQGGSQPLRAGQSFAAGSAAMAGVTISTDSTDRPARALVVHRYNLR